IRGYAVPSTEDPVTNSLYRVLGTACFQLLTGALGTIPGQSKVRDRSRHAQANERNRVAGVGFALDADAARRYLQTGLIVQAEHHLAVWVRNHVAQGDVVMVGVKPAGLAFENKRPGPQGEQTAGTTIFHRRPQLSSLPGLEPRHRGRRPTYRPADVVPPAEMVQIGVVPFGQWPAGQMLIHQTGVGVLDTNVRPQAPHIGPFGQQGKQGGPARHFPPSWTFLPQDARFPGGGGPQGLDRRLA